MSGVKAMNVPVNFNLTNRAQIKQQMKELASDFNSILNMSSYTKNGGFATGLTSEINEAIKATSQLKVAISDAINPLTGNLDLTKFNQSLQQSGRTLTDYYNSMSKLGSTGNQTFKDLAKSIVTAETPLLRTSNAMRTLWTTMGNTVRWQASTAALQKVTSTVSNAMNYVQNLDKSLNSIQIVTGQSQAQMDKFATSANAAAKALSTTTNAYAQASLIYYQQGLSSKQVQERTEATIKLANVSGQSAARVSDQMTSIWNNFYDGSKSLEHYADVITALGATTASSSEEIAQGLSKFSSIAKTTGLSYEYATSALATVTAATRQSADQVGTSFKTLFSRLEGLSLGETLDDGTSLNKYSQALLTVGVNIKSANGELKKMDTILDELGGKWNNLSQDTQVALAQTVGGVRNYTSLLSLMDNWESFQTNLKTAKASEGTLQAQEDIYDKSWAAAKKRVQASAETIYSNLLDDDFFKGLTNFNANVLNAVGGATKSGMGTNLIGLLSFATNRNVFGTQIANGLTNMGYNVSSFFGGTSKAEATRREAQKLLERQADQQGGTPLEKEISLRYAARYGEYNDRLAKGEISQADMPYYQAILRMQDEQDERAIQANKNYQQAEKNSKQSTRTAASEVYKEQLNQYNKDKIGYEQVQAKQNNGIPLTAEDYIVSERYNANVTQNEGKYVFNASEYQQANKKFFESNETMTKAYDFAREKGYHDNLMESIKYGTTEHNINGDSDVNQAVQNISNLIAGNDTFSKIADLDEQIGKLSNIDTSKITDSQKEQLDNLRTQRENEFENLTETQKSLYRLNSDLKANGTNDVKKNQELIDNFYKNEVENYSDEEMSNRISEATDALQQNLGISDRTTAENIVKSVLNDKGEAGGLKFLDELNTGADRSGESPELSKASISTAEALTTVTSALGSTVATLSTGITTMQVFSDANATASEKLGALGGVAMNLGNAISSNTDLFKNFGKTIGDTSITMGGFAAGVAAVAAAAFAGVSYVEYYNQDSLNNQVEDLSELVATSSQVTSENKSRYENLSVLEDTYDSNVSKLSQLEKGTSDYTTALLETNEAAMSMIDEYNLQYGTDYSYKNGRIDISQNAIDQKKEDTLQEYTDAVMSQNLTSMAYKMFTEQQDIVSSEKSIEGSLNGADLFQILDKDGIAIYENKNISDFISKYVAPTGKTFQQYLEDNSYTLQTKQEETYGSYSEDGTYLGEEIPNYTAATAEDLKNIETYTSQIEASSIQQKAWAQGMIETFVSSVSDSDMMKSLTASMLETDKDVVNNMMSDVTEALTTDNATWIGTMFQNLGLGALQGTSEDQINKLYKSLGFGENLSDEDIANLDLSEKTYKVYAQYQKNALQSRYDTTSVKIRDNANTDSNWATAMSYKQMTTEEAISFVKSLNADINTEYTNLSSALENSIVQTSSNLETALLKYTNTIGSISTGVVDYGNIARSFASGTKLSLADQEILSNYLVSYGSIYGKDFGQSMLENFLSEGNGTLNQGYLHMLNSVDMSNSISGLLSQLNWTSQQSGNESNVKMGLETFTKRLEGMGGNESLFNEIYKSEDFLKVLGTLQEDFAIYGEITAENISDAAEKSGTLADMLKVSSNYSKLTADSQQKTYQVLNSAGIASALTALEKGTITSGQITNTLLNALSASGSSSAIASEAFDIVDNLDFGRSGSEMTDIFQAAYKTYKTAASENLTFDAPMTKAIQMLAPTKVQQQYYQAQENGNGKTFSGVINSNNIDSDFMAMFTDKKLSMEDVIDSYGDMLETAFEETGKSFADYGIEFTEKDILDTQGGTSDNFRNRLYQMFSENGWTKDSANQLATIFTEYYDSSSGGYGHQKANAAEGWNDFLKGENAPGTDKTGFTSYDAWKAWYDQYGAILGSTQGYLTDNDGNYVDENGNLLEPGEAPVEFKGWTDEKGAALEYINQGGHFIFGDTTSRTLDKDNITVQSFMEHQNLAMQDLGLNGWGDSQNLTGNNSAFVKMMQDYGAIQNGVIDYDTMLQIAQQAGMTEQDLVNMIENTVGTGDLKETLGYDIVKSSEDNYGFSKKFSMSDYYGTNRDYVKRNGASGFVSDYTRLEETNNPDNVADQIANQYFYDSSSGQYIFDPQGVIRQKAASQQNEANNTSLTAEDVDNVDLNIQAAEGSKQREAQLLKIGRERYLTEDEQAELRQIHSDQSDLIDRQYDYASNGGQSTKGKIEQIIENQSGVDAQGNQLSGNAVNALTALRDAYQVATDKNDVGMQTKILAQMNAILDNTDVLTEQGEDLNDAVIDGNGNALTGDEEYEVDSDGNLKKKNGEDALEMPGEEEDQMGTGGDYQYGGSGDSEPEKFKMTINDGNGGEKSFYVTDNGDGTYTDEDGTLYDQYGTQLAISAAASGINNTKIPGYAEGLEEYVGKEGSIAVTGELGPELRVKSDGSSELLGKNGREYTWVEPDDKIYTANQTQSILGSNNIAELKQYSEGLNNKIPGFAIKTTDSSGSTNNGGSSGSGGSDIGGGGEAEEDYDHRYDANWLQYRDIETRYFTILEQIQDITNEISQFAATADRLWGKERLDAIDKEINAYYDQIDAQEKYVNEIKAQLDVDKSTLTTMVSEFVNDYNKDIEDKRKAGTAESDLPEELSFTEAEFDENGVLTNYKDFVETLIDQYNNNASKDSTAQYKFQEQIKDIQFYTETLNLLEEQEYALQDLKDTVQDLNISKILQEVQLKVSLSDDDLALINFSTKRIDDNAYETAKQISNLGASIKESMEKTQTYSDSLADILAEYTKQGGVSDGERMLYSLFNLKDGDTSGLYSLLVDNTEDFFTKFSDLETNQDFVGGFTTDTIEQFRTIRDSILTQQQSILNDREDWFNALNDAFKSFNKELDNEVNNFVYFSTVLDDYKNIIDLTGQEIAGISDDLLKSINDKTIQNSINKAESLKKIYEAKSKYTNELEIAYNNALEKYNNDLNNGEVLLWKEQLDNATKELQDSEEEWLTAWKDALQTATTAYKDNISQITKNFSDSMSPLIGDLDYLQEIFNKQSTLNDEYVDDFQKMHDLSALARDIQNSIDDTDSIKGKKELKSLQEDINDLLESGAELSEYDLNVLQEKYNLELARQALEDAKDAKNTVRMTRDANGNWGYVYTANQDDIDEAEQNYEDKLLEYQNLSEDYIENLEGQMISLESEYTNAIAALDPTDEDYEEKLKNLADYYAERIDYMGNQMNNALDNQKELESTITNYFGEDINIIDDFSETVLSAATGFATVNDVVNNFLQGMSDTNAQALSEWAEVVKVINEQINDSMTNGTGLSNYIGKEVEEISEDTDDNLDTIVDDLDRMSNSMEDSLSGILNQLEKFKEENGAYIDDIVDQYEKFAEAITKLINLEYDYHPVLLNYDTETGTSDARITEEMADWNTLKKDYMNQVVGEEAELLPEEKALYTNSLVKYIKEYNDNIYNLMEQEMQDFKDKNADWKESDMTGIKMKYEQKYFLNNSSDKENNYGLYDVNYGLQNDEELTSDLKDMYQSIIKYFEDTTNADNKTSMLNKLGIKEEDLDNYLGLTNLSDEERETKIAELTKEYENAIESIDNKYKEIETATQEKQDRIYDEKKAEGEINYVYLKNPETGTITKYTPEEYEALLENLEQGAAYELGENGFDEDSRTEYNDVIKRLETYGETYIKIGDELTKITDQNDKILTDALAAIEKWEEEHPEQVASNGTATGEYAAWLNAIGNMLPGYTKTGNSTDYNSSAWWDTGGYTGRMEYADTGMYTGEWPNGSVRANGKLAILHQKELVLNADDTENFLSAVDILRKLDLNALQMANGLSNIDLPSLDSTTQEALQQDVHIEASFPNVSDRSEIEAAFDNLVNRASQYANRKSL